MRNRQLLPGVRLVGQLHKPDCFIGVDAQEKGPLAGCRGENFVDDIKPLIGNRVVERGELPLVCCFSHANECTSAMQLLAGQNEQGVALVRGATIGNAEHDYAELLTLSRVLFGAPWVTLFRFSYWRRGILNGGPSANASFQKGSMSRTSSILKP